MMFESDFDFGWDQPNKPLLCVNRKYITRWQRFGQMRFDFSIEPPRALAVFIGHWFEVVSARALGDSKPTEG